MRHNSEKIDSSGSIDPRYGRSGPLDEEIRRERSSARERGEDPNEAERRFRATFEVAHQRLRASQEEKAIKSRGSKSERVIKATVKGFEEVFNKDK